MINRGGGLERRQAVRLAVLKYMYDVAVEQKNDPDRTEFDVEYISRDLEHSEQDIASALPYLEGERLVEVTARFIGGNANYKISHRGIKEVEGVYSAPESGTDHFSPQVIQNLTFQGPVGTVQTGSNATAHVTQNIGADLSSMFALIEQLRQQIDDLQEDEQEEAQVNLDMLEAELKNDKEPKKIRVFVKRLAALGRGAAAAVGFGANATTLVTQAQTLGLS